MLFSRRGQNYGFLPSGGPFFLFLHLNNGYHGFLGLSSFSSTRAKTGSSVEGLNLSRKAERDRRRKTQTVHLTPWPNGLRQQSAG